MFDYHYQGGPFDTQEEAEEFAKSVIPPIVIGTPIGMPDKFGVWTIRQEAQNG